MSGAVIGKSLNLGWIGKITRVADKIVDSRIVSRTETNPINFGSPVFLNDDDTFRALKTSELDMEKFVGIAVAEVKQATSYFDDAVNYMAGSQCDVLTRGSIMVQLNSTAVAPKAGGSVYLIKATGLFDSGAGVEGTTLKLPNATFTTGNVDANKAVEITLLSKNVI